MKSEQKEKECEREGISCIWRGAAADATKRHRLTAKGANKSQLKIQENVLNPER